MGLVVDSSVGWGLEPVEAHLSLEPVCSQRDAPARLSGGVVTNSLPLASTLSPEAT